MQYGSTILNYTHIDSLLMVIASVGNFSAEYRKEIANLLTSAANLSYLDAVKLVGVANIDNVLIHVAGVDGNFVL